MPRGSRERQLRERRALEIHFGLGTHEHAGLTVVLSNGKKYSFPALRADRHREVNLAHATCEKSGAACLVRTAPKLRQRTATYSRSRRIPGERDSAKRKSGGDHTFAAAA